MKLIHSLYIEDEEFEQLQKDKHTNFTNNSVQIGLTMNKTTTQ